MSIIETPVRSEGQMNTGIYIMMSAFIPTFVVIAGLPFGMSVTVSACAAAAALLLFVAGAIIANWRVASLVLIFAMAVFPVLYLAIFRWLPVWLPRMGINF